MADRDLAERFRDGDPDALAALYRQYAGAVFALARRSLGERGLAEEVVQLTFLKAWQAAGRLDTERPLAPWLYTIARRAAIDVHRRERHHPRPGVDETELVALPPSFERSWETWEVRRALDRLPSSDRDLLRLTHYEGLTHVEAAARLGIPLGTVKSRSHAATRRLAALLDHLAEEPA